MAERIKRRSVLPAISPGPNIQFRSENINVMRDVTNTFEGLASRAKAVADKERIDQANFDHASEQRREVFDADLAGTAAGAGGDATLRPGGTRPDIAFNQAALTSYAAGLEMNGRQRYVELETKHEANPSAYASEAKAYTDGLLAEIEGEAPELVAPIRAKLALVSSDSLNRINKAHKKKQELHTGGVAVQYSAQIQRETPLRIKSLFDENPDNVANIMTHFSTDMARLEELGHAAKWTPEKIAKHQVAMRDFIYEQAYLERVRRAPNKLGLHTKLLAGEPLQLTGPMTTTVTKASPTQQRIVAEADRQDIGSDLVLRIASLESGFKAKAVNLKVGEAHRPTGLFQLTPGTRDAMGAPDTTAMTPADAAAVDSHYGVKLIKENAATLRRALGVEPTQGNVYMAHMLGAGGAITMIQAGGRRSALAVLKETPGLADRAEKILSQNRFAKDITVRQLHKAFEDRMSRARVGKITKETTTVSPRAELSTAAYARVTTYAKTLADENETERRVALTEKLADARANAEATGDVDHFTIEDRAEYGTIYGQERLNAAERDIAASAATHAVGTRMKTASPASRAEIIEQLKPTDGENAARETVVYEAALREEAKIRTAVEKDSLTYTLQHSEIAQEAQKAIIAGETLALRETAAAQLIEEQRRVGAHPGQVKLLTEPAAEKIVALMKAGAEPGQMFASIKQIVETYGVHAPIVYSNLRDAGADTAIVAFQAASDRGGSLLAEAISDELREGKGFLTGQVKEADGDLGFTKTLFVDAIHTELEPFLATLPPNNLGTAAAYSRAVSLMAAKKIIGGATQADAISTSVDDLVGHNYQFSESVRIPVTEQPELVDSGIDLWRGSLDKRRIVTDVQSRDPRMSERQITAAYLETVKRLGRPVTAPDETGIMINDPLGQPIMVADGEDDAPEPLIITWSELRRMGTPDPRALPFASKGAGP